MFKLTSEDRDRIAVIFGIAYAMQLPVSTQAVENDGKWSFLCRYESFVVVVWREPSPLTRDQVWDRLNSMNKRLAVLQDMFPVGRGKK